MPTSFPGAVGAARGAEGRAATDGSRAQVPGLSRTCVRDLLLAAGYGGALLIGWQGRHVRGGAHGDRAGLDRGDQLRRPGLEHLLGAADGEGADVQDGAGPLAHALAPRGCS